MAVAPIAGAGNAAYLQVAKPVVNQIHTPFQMLLDNAAQALAGVSKMEEESNSLMKKYVAGEAQIDDVVYSTTKLNFVCCRNLLSPSATKQ